MSDIDLEQEFKNNFDCYVDAEVDMGNAPSIEITEPAMSKCKFIEVVDKLLQANGDNKEHDKALRLPEVMPRFYLGQEVQTKDGKGIIVDLKMQWNGLHIQPNKSEAVVWYSTESAANRTEGGNWVSFTYRLTELSAS